MRRMLEPLPSWAQILYRSDDVSSCVIRYRSLISSSTLELLSLANQIQNFHSFSGISGLATSQERDCYALGGHSLQK